MLNLKICPVCGGTDFKQLAILWDDLIQEWQLSTDEVHNINRQQGFICQQCGNNLRSMALAQALMSEYGYTGLFKNFIHTPYAQSLAVLEINDAGFLSKYLNQLPLYRIIKYPEFDMMDLSKVNQTFDVIVHSDTLEHIPDPVRALEECHKLLRPNGKCAYTIPTVVGRLSRSRANLPPSFHSGGSNDADGEALRVHTEFGADAWTYVMRAGYSKVTVHALCYPAALTYVAHNSNNAN